MIFFHCHYVYYCLNQPNLNYCLKISLDSLIYFKGKDLFKLFDYLNFLKFILECQKIYIALKNIHCF